MGVLNNEELEAVHTIERYGTALNAGDAVTIAEELFAADGQFYPAGQPTVVGTKALLETYEGLAKIPGGFKLTFHISDSVSVWVWSSDDGFGAFHLRGHSRRRGGGVP